MKGHPILVSNQHFLEFGQPLKVEFTYAGQEQLVNGSQNFESSFLHHGISLPEDSKNNADEKKRIGLEIMENNQGIVKFKLFKNPMKFLYPIVAFLLFARCSKHAAVSEDSTTSDTASYPTEIIDFTPYEKNPVFSGTGKSTWDSVIREYSV